MIIAYKKGKWFVHIGRYMYPRDYSRVALGLDLEAKVIQYGQGLVFYRFRKNQTKMIDVKKILYGKITPVWEPFGEVTKYRFKDHVFELQQIHQYEHRPRQKPAYKRLEQSWWSVLSVDGKPAPTPLFSYQRAEDALSAMTGYIRTTEIIKIKEGHSELVDKAKVVYLF